MIYLDQAATSFPKPQSVIEAVNSAMSGFSASPGRSGHQYSLTASRTIFDARETVAELLGVPDSSRIAFTLNVTQGLNTALLGYLRPGDHVLTTSMEHNSVMRPLAWLAGTREVEVEIIRADRDGLVDPDDFHTRLRTNTRLAVVNHASNVIGTLAPLKKIKAALDGVPLLVDAAQSAGAVPLSPAERLADMVAFTGHKGLLGPTGTGGLWIGPDLEIEALVRGGTGSRSEREEQPDFMPDALEAGTANTHGLAGLAAGIKFIQDTGVNRIRDHERELTGIFLDGLSQIKDLSVYGPKNLDGRVAVVSVNLDGWSPSDLTRTLDQEYGIMTRPGLHCAPRAHQTLGTFPQGAVRFSFGWSNTAEELGKSLAALDALSRRPN